MNRKKIQILTLCVILVTLLVVCLTYSKNLKTNIEYQTYPREYQEFVEKYASACDIDPNLIYAVIRTESGFDPNAVSDVGARGLMQLTEEAYAWIAFRLDRTHIDNYDLMFDAETNILYGTYYMYLSMEKYGDISVAAASYHSGWGAIDKLLVDPYYSDDGKTLKEYPYTQMSHYVYKINENYKKYTELYGEEGAKNE